MLKLVSIIIVTRGIKDYLESCLQSVRRQSHPNFETIVIDNSKTNLFYCAALNKGIKQSKGDFILCLNDDVTLDRRFIENALEGFVINERIGIVSGKIMRCDGKIIDSTGLFLSPWRTAKERGYGVKNLGQFETEGYIFGVNGAVAFYRKEMLEDIKEGDDYFDADFRIFYEDLDIAWRAQRMGWRAYYMPQAIAYHIRGGTVRKVRGINKSYALRYINQDLSSDLIKNRYLVLVKNESFLDFLLHLPWIFFYDSLVWSYILFFRFSLIKKFLLNLKYLKSAFKKRKEMAKKQRFWKELLLRQVPTQRIS